ncbi:T6SS effector BTH_I2691 family protein, partial [Burkholderia sp. AW50-3]
LEDDGVNYVVTAVKYIGKLTDYYKKYSKLALETNPAKISYLGAMYKEQGRDVLLMAIGDRVFEKLRINKLGDFVGEKIVQTLFLQRAGLPVEDALTLVRKQALYDKVSRSEILQRFRTARTVLAGATKAGPNPTTELYEVWEKLKADKDANAMKELRLGRIAVIAALCELVNFWHLLSEAKDEDTNAKLIKSGASLSASIITITMTPYYGTLKKAVRTMSWKLAGGLLSGAGAFAAAWIDNRAAKGKGKSGQYDVMIVLYGKALIGLASGAAFVIDAVSTAAPLFKKLAARSGSRVVIMAVETVAPRVAMIASLRAVSMLITWEATIGLLALQVLADVLIPDELESWCSRCAFGTGREAILRVKDHGIEKYADMQQQEKAFDEAMTEMA